MSNEVHLHVLIQKQINILEDKLFFFVVAKEPDGKLTEKATCLFDSCICVREKKTITTDHDNKTMQTDFQTEK